MSPVRRSSMSAPDVGGTSTEPTDSQAALQLAVRALAATGGAIYTWEPDAEALVPLASDGVLRHEQLAMVAQHYRDSPLDAALRGHEATFTLPAVPSKPEAPFAAVLRSVGVHSLLALPLVQGERTLGVLIIGWPSRPLRIDRALAGLIAAHAAATIVTVELQAQLEREQRLVDRLSYIFNEMTRHVAENISAGLTPLDVLPKLIASAASVLSARAGVLSRVQDDAATMRVDAVYGLPPEIIGQRFPIGEGLTGRVVATGEPVLLGEGQSLEERWFPRRDGSDPPVWLAVPISLHNTYYGALTLVAEPPQRLTMEDAVMLTMFARSAALSIANARLHERALQVAALDERQRLARDLHDSVTQTLFSLQYAAQSAWDSWNGQPEHAQSALELVLQLARGANVEMRELLFELRPEVLNAEGLASALEKHIAVVRHRSGLMIDLQVEGADRLPAAYEEALYRIVQEALANVVKHARAIHACVRLSFAETITVRIEDDGVGLDETGPQVDSFGLRGMHERVSQLGGTLSVGNRAEGGAFVHAELPFPA